MKIFYTSRLPQLLGGALLAGALHATATPVTFSVTGARLSPGTGYGVDARENVGTQLDVLFSTTGFSAQQVVLTAVGDAFTFGVGTLDFRESHGSGGILAAEMEGLDVTASLTLAHPLDTTWHFTATGVATAGSINGNDALNGGTDYTLSWSPFTDLAFGNGGLFDVDFSPMAFSTTSDSVQPLLATFTLRALPSSPPVTPGNLPEPGSLALIATALTLTGWSTRYRRTKTRD